MKAKVIGELLVALQQRNPHMRLGQLLQNAIDSAAQVDEGHRDLFYVSDAELLSALTSAATKYAEKH